MYPGVLAVSMRKYVYAALPTLIVVSGVFQYFRNADVLGFIADAKKAFADAAACAREAGCELVEVRPFYTAARRTLKGKAGLYTRIAMAVTDRTGRAFILHVKL